MYLFYQQAALWMRFDRSITKDTTPAGEAFPPRGGNRVEVGCDYTREAVRRYSRSCAVCRVHRQGKEGGAINFRDSSTDAPFSGIDDQTFADAIHRYTDSLDYGQYGVVGFIDDIVMEGAYHDISFYGGSWKDIEGANEALVRAITDRGGSHLLGRLSRWEQEVAAITQRYEARLNGEVTGLASSIVNPAITEGVNLVSWPEGGEGTFQLKKGKARITGKAEGGVLHVKMITGTDTADIDQVIRDFVRKAYESDLKQLTMPRPD